MEASAPHLTHVPVLLVGLIQTALPLCAHKRAQMVAIVQPTTLVVALVNGRARIAELQFANKIVPTAATASLLTRASALPSGSITTAQCLCVPKVTSKQIPQEVLPISTRLKCLSGQPINHVTFKVGVMQLMNLSVINWKWLII